MLHWEYIIGGFESAGEVREGLPKEVSLSWHLIDEIPC